MEVQAKVCQNCKKDFTVESEDFNFYKKINVPAPTWCPDCRFNRRISFQNTWNLFWRNCDKCHKKTLSIYSPNSKLIIYCPSCWWADDWDGSEYAAEYDPNRTFFEQANELWNKTPHVALSTAHTTLKNSDYCNDIGWCRDCYLIFWADFCENVFYSSILNGLKHSSDCVRGYNSELCYGSIGFVKGYRNFFSDECESCVDVWFSRNCQGCTNCIGCVNLRNATNCIFNVQYSKDGYLEKIEKLKLNSWKNLQELQNQAHKFWLTKPYREYSGHSFNVNVTGEHVYYSRNSKEMYLVSGAENCKWCQFITVPPIKDSYDYSGWGNNTSRMYESNTIGENCDSVFFSLASFPDCLNLEYCFQNIAGKNNFGCFNLKRKSYSILNKQYKKEDFLKLKKKIIEDMKETPFVDERGRKFYYGEFFPPSFSRFSYNKSNSMRFFPKTKEEVLREGYTWDDFENPNNLSSVQASSLPDTIEETKDRILREVIECANCKRGYKIVKGELDLLRKLVLPLPHECPRCRENRRFARMTKPKMYHRNCQKCGVPIYTPYAPDEPNIVYCVDCYQQEFA